VPGGGHADDAGAEDDDVHGMLLRALCPADDSRQQRFKNEETFI
jgi:hypothetical protein